MKCWQTVFARNLRARVSAEPPSPWTIRRFLRVLALHTAWQPSGLFLLPLALVPALPFGWLYAFYQNVTALADGHSGDAKAVVKKSWQQAVLWPRQNHAVLSILIAFGRAVFLNLLTVGFALP